MSNIQCKPVKCVLCSTGQGTSVGCQRWKVTSVSTWGGGDCLTISFSATTSCSALRAVHWIGFGRLSVYCFEVQFSLQLQQLVRTTKYSNRNSRCSREDSKHEAYLKKTWNFRRGKDGLYSVLYYIVHLWWLMIYWHYSLLGCEVRFIHIIHTDWGNRLLRNIDQYLPGYGASHSRRQ